MDNGQTTLNALLRSLRKDHLVVRVAIERSPKPVFRMMVVDALPEPPLVGRAVSDYGRATFLETSISANRLGNWLRQGRGRVCSVSFLVPKAQQDHVSWSPRRPSASRGASNCRCRTGSLTTAC